MDSTKPEAKNHHFVQVNKTYMDDYARLIQRHPAAASLLIFLSARMGRSNNAIVISYKSMMELTNYSRVTIVNALKVLREQAWLDTVRIGSVKAYAINEKFVWQKANNQRHYAEFSATCIAAKSEQDVDRIRTTREKLRYLPHVEAEAR